MTTILPGTTMSDASSSSPSQPAPVDDSTQPDARTGEITTDFVRVLKLLADETRLRILLFLNEHGELNVRSLCEMLDQSQPAVSHHLALLRVDGLIGCRRDGKHNFYRILPRRFGQLIRRVAQLFPGNGDEIRLGDNVLGIRSVEGGETLPLGD